MNTETELKFAVGEDDVERITKWLIEAGAQKIQSSIEEKNRLFDYPDQRLRKAGKVLRIRNCGRKSRLTFKGPERSDTPLKQRTEIESDLSSGQNLEAILAELGLELTCTYRKHREIWSLHGEDNPVEISVDRTTAGVFIEIEGSPEGVSRVAGRLGMEPGEAVRATYPEILGRDRTGKP